MGDDDEIITTDIIDLEYNIQDWDNWDYNIDANYRWGQTAPIIMKLGAEVMLEILPDVFYVRGKKVEQNDEEARIVYNTFTQWLSWQALDKNKE